jgi:hypothetical protein
MLNNDITIFVNSCDSFEDCWDPFFNLLSKNWAYDSMPNIILNTEFKSYQGYNLPIVSTKVNEGIDYRMNWSQCFLKGLDFIKTDYFIYLQEDYFINSKIDVKLINDLVEVIKSNSLIDYIGLTDNGSSGPFIETSDDRLWNIPNQSFYKISCQAAIWRKTSLQSLILEDENPWMFEIFGSIRAGRKNSLFLTVNRLKFSLNENPIIGYLHTGIIKGKWNIEIQEVFKSNQISIDYSKRGFYEKKKYSKITLALKLVSKPRYFFICIWHWIFRNNKLLSNKTGFVQLK